MAVRQAALQLSAVHANAITPLNFSFNLQNAALNGVWWRLRAIWIKNLTPSTTGPIALVLQLSGMEVFRVNLPAIPGGEIGQANIMFPNTALATTPPAGDPAILQPQWLPDELRHNPTDSMTLDTGTSGINAGTILIAIVVDYEDGICRA